MNPFSSGLGISGCGKSESKILWPMNDLMCGWIGQMDQLMGKRGFGPVIRVDGCVASFILIGYQVISDVIDSFCPQFVPFSLNDTYVVDSFTFSWVAEWRRSLRQQLARSEGCLWLLLALISNEVDPFTYIPYMQTLRPLLFETARSEL